MATIYRYTFARSKYPDRCDCPALHRQLVRVICRHDDYSLLKSSSRAPTTESNGASMNFAIDPDQYRVVPRGIFHTSPGSDWQMWFAALSDPSDAPWFGNFLRRLLENDPAVLSLLADKPFPDHPPK